MGVVDDLDRGFERLMLAGRWAVGLYRLSRAAWKARIPLLPYLIQMLNGLLHGCEIHYRAAIGRGFRIAHPRGIVVGQNVRAGEGLTLYTSVVLGVKHTGVPSQPTFGKDVTIYAGAKVLGGVTVGDHVTIGANAVVTRDLQNGALVAGVPARVVGLKGIGGRRMPTFPRGRALIGHQSHDRALARGLVRVCRASGRGASTGTPGGTRPEDEAADESRV